MRISRIHQMFVFTTFLCLSFCLVGWDSPSSRMSTAKSQSEGECLIPLDRPFILWCFTWSDLISSSITRTFGSGKTEKGIFQALKELGLPSGKVRKRLNSWCIISNVIIKRLRISDVQMMSSRLSFILFIYSIYFYLGYLFSISNHTYAWYFELTCIFIYSVVNQVIEVLS